MAAANTYDKAWMKSKIGTNDAKKRRCSVQLLAEPSPTNALRAAPWNPNAHAAAASSGANEGQLARAAPRPNPVPWASGCLWDWPGLALFPRKQGAGWRGRRPRLRGCTAAGNPPPPRWPPDDPESASDRRPT